MGFRQMCSKMIDFEEFDFNLHSLRVTGESRADYCFIVLEYGPDGYKSCSYRASKGIKGFGLYHLECRRLSSC